MIATKNGCMSGAPAAFGIAANCPFVNDIIAYCQTSPRRFHAMPKNISTMNAFRAHSMRFNRPIDEARLTADVSSGSRKNHWKCANRNCMDAGMPRDDCSTMAWPIPGWRNIVQTITFCRMEIIKVKPDKTMKIHASTVTKLERLPVAFISHPGTSAK